MKRTTLVLLVVAGILAFTGCEKNDADFAGPSAAKLTAIDPQDGDVIPGQYIVVLNESVLKSIVPQDADYDIKKQEVEKIARSLFAKKSTGAREFKNIYAQTIKGFAAILSDEEVAALERDEKVAYVVADRMFILRPPWEDPEPDPDPDPAGQETPYGIARVGSGDGAATGKTAWIIDTGIDLDHPDLNVDASRGAVYVRSRNGADDDNGHGTHCAGIVAAIDNDFGVVGVAAGATVVPVKVLDKRGSGAYSGIIEGIDYVAANAGPGDVANMSLGGSFYEPINDAVIAAAQGGLLFALAAGNESSDAATKSPASAEHNNIFTISAMDANDEWAYFSNFGNPPVDYCEPGVAIYSTYKDGGYTSMSGTSMASPHMCGILLMTGGKPSSDGNVIGDPDNTPDPIGVL